MSTAVRERIFVDKKMRLSLYENNLVSIHTSDGRVIEGVEPRRLFPVSSSNNYITLLDKDGNEVALIRSVSDLDKESEAVLRASLDDYYLVPTICRIIGIVDKYGTLRWTVETDRGEKTFDVRDRNHDIRVYRDGRIRVRDSDDNRYVIGDYKKMDRKSQRWLAPFI